MPTMGQPSNTTVMPPKKEREAFTLCRWKKKKNVRWMPITAAKPLMNRIWKKLIFNLFINFYISCLEHSTGHNNV